jgi:uncharacterized NAD(P)/FAD-binding protein YdhS
VLVAAHLLERHRDADVMIAEPRAELGRGLAYSTPWHQHLLNVPAGQMSAFASKPSHFVEWLARQGWPGGGGFAPRNVYGGYLQDTLAGAIAGTAGRT